MLRVRSASYQGIIVNPLSTKVRYFFGTTKTLTDEEIISASNWKERNSFKRLGLKPWQMSQDNVKRHYRVLAKHYHPDSGNGSNSSGDAFKAIQEAYEKLSVKKSTQTYDESDESDDTKRRRSQVRFMGSAVNIFLLATFVYIFVVARHNRQRLGKSYIEHCVVLFAILQALPRLMASAVIFSYLSTLLVENEEALSRSKALLVVEKISPRSLKLRVDGFSDDQWKDINLELVLHVGDDANSTRNDATSQSSHLKFDKGVREVVVPLPPMGPKQFGGVDVFAVSEGSRLLIANKYFPF